ncbi:MAG: 4,5:9,10-diseco-3-hydroxy-5,9,17-trioxoandrosta-1(10),2-diene-4-oate hydrolase [Candidatus Hydrogenedentes bacterium ADurb.Bin170]|jgi:pimeloyl-ACP methyl ester carboxylesterase|nr:MAG: 4,5:9,10-diseco-3-hydroxy-5,9,17-trioxoandrosta-1(10),2-diene-4-oate hydrolase [Candidatus Hydrogenedentes bacterium ADurb.Bin170]
MSMKRKLSIFAAIVAGTLFLAASCLFYLLFHRSPGQFFEQDGTRLFYSDTGRGEAVILVHGIAAQGDLNWRRPGVTRMLAKQFRVITLDMRGHGLSDRPEDAEHYGIHLVTDIIGLMDHLSIDKAHLAGYSLGGFVALKAVALYPDRFLSAAICSAGWINPESPGEIPNPYQAPVKNAEIKTSHASVMMPVASKSVFHRIRSGVGDMLIDRKVKKALKASYPELGVLREDVETIKTPLLCIIGTKDGFLHLARALCQFECPLECIEIGGATHFSAPFKSEFKKNLLLFFQKNSPRHK